jgi:hypothetical protein
MKAATNASSRARSQFSLLAAPNSFSMPMPGYDSSPRPAWVSRQRLLTKSLCRRPSFDMASLQRSALCRLPNRRGRAQEVAVFENTLGARVGARALARRANFRLPSLRNLAHILLAIFSLAAAAVLFFGWLMLSKPSRPAISSFGAESDCESLGRGGARCTKRPMADGQSDTGSGQDDDCASLGKGGRVCAGHP